MPQSPIRNLVTLALFAGASLACAPLCAETMEELDALSDVSANEQAGVAAAQALANEGYYLDALAMLERVLAVFPKSTDARMIHALYLCQIDDQQGGLVELGELKNKNYGKQLLRDARAQCERGPVAVEPAQ